MALGTVPNTASHTHRTKKKRMNFVVADTHPYIGVPANILRMCSPHSRRCGRRVRSHVATSLCDRSEIAVWKNMLLVLNRNNHVSLAPWVWPTLWRCFRNSKTLLWYACSSRWLGWHFSCDHSFWYFGANIHMAPAETHQNSIIQSVSNQTDTNVHRTENEMFHAMFASRSRFLVDLSNNSGHVSSIAYLAQLHTTIDKVGMSSSYNFKNTKFHLWQFSEIWCFNTWLELDPTLSVESTSRQQQKYTQLCHPMHVLP